MSLKIRVNPTRFIDKITSICQKFKMEVSAHHQMSDDYTELYGRLPLKVHLAYGLGHVLNDVCASMWFTYLLVFFHLVLNFNNWQTGCMLLVGQVADAVATPFVGYHSDQSDNFWFCGYGRRKTWHLFGTICVLGAFPFIFSRSYGDQQSDKSAQMFYYCMFIIIFQFGWAAVQISHLSLIPELTPNEHDRTKLTAIRYCFTVISNVLVYVVTWAILHMAGGEKDKIGPQDEPKFQHVVWSVLSVGIVCSLLFHVLVKEASSDGTNNVRGGRLRTSVRDLLTNFRVYHVAFIYMSSRLFVNLTQIFIPLYLHETLDMNASSLALVPLVMFIGSFVTSMLLERINRCCGRKITYSVGAALASLACVWVNFGEKANTDYTSYYIYIVALLFGSGGSIILVSSLGVTTDLIGEKTDSGAFVFGIMSFTDKLANGVAVVIIQKLHNNHDNLESPYYRDVLTRVCGTSAFLGAIAVICLFTRTRVRDLSYENVPNYNSINS